MSPTLKDCIDPWKAASRNQLISGYVVLQQLPRLSTVLLEDQGKISVSLAFEKNHDRLPVMTGRITGSLQLTCNRCLQAMQLDVDQQLEVVFVHYGRASQDLHEQYDLYEVEDERVCLLDLIEDELFLQIPQVPKHDNPVCIVETEFGDAESAQVEQEEKENPFAVLASLKKPN